MMMDRAQTNFMVGFEVPGILASAQLDVTQSCKPGDQPPTASTP